MADKIRTLNELKVVIDQLVEEGKGDWPVVHKADEGPVYTPVKVYAIDPDEVPDLEGLQLDQSFVDAPDGKHIVVDFGQYE